MKYTLSLLLCLYLLPANDYLKTITQVFEANGYSAIPVAKWSPDYLDGATPLAAEEELQVAYPDNEIKLSPIMGGEGERSFKFNGTVTSMVFKKQTNAGLKPDCKVTYIQYISAKDLNEDMPNIKELSSFILSSSDGLKQPNFILRHNNAVFLVQCRAVAFEQPTKEIMKEVLKLLSE